MGITDLKAAIARRGEAGLTIIEISLVLVIIGLLTAVSIPLASNVTRAKLKSGAMQLAGAVRYSYNSAVSENKAARLVFDLEEGRYWPEGAADRFVLGREKVSVFQGEAVEEEPREEEPVEEETSGLIGPFGILKDFGKKETSFQAFPEKFAEPVELPDGVYIDGVYTSHQEDRVTVGNAYLYFFPSGMTEFAVIHLVDDDGRFFTLMVKPLTGRTEVFSEYLKWEDLEE